MIFHALTAPRRRGSHRGAEGALALAAALGLTAPMAQASPGLDLTLAAGSGKVHVHKLGLVLGWTRPDPLWQGRDWRLLLRHEAELANWRVPQARDLVELGYSPVLRLEHPLDGGKAAFFIEGSIGVRLLSHTQVGADRNLSTAFQFSDELRAGWQWGEQGRHTAGLRFQHISNADIKRPNPGMNFWQVYYRYHF